MQAVLDFGPPLDARRHTEYRSVCMRPAFLAQDKWEFKFATKECARHMSSPIVFGLEGLKGIGRLLKHMPRVVQRLERQPPPKELVVYIQTPITQVAQ